MIEEQWSAKSKVADCKRDVLPDVLKGFGIILMVLGHCIQGSYSGIAGNAYFDDKMYQFIYSFHMPLFMVISGYYAWNSVHRAKTFKDRQKMIKKKCIYLITPSVAWTLINYLYLSVTGSLAYVGAGVLLHSIFVSILTNFWFLWAILYSFLLVCLMHYHLRDSVWVYVLIFAAMFVTPDGLGLMACKYMLPYYLIGFYINKNKESVFTVTNQGRRKGIACIVSGVCFLCLESFFNADTFIYLTGYKLIGKDVMTQLQIDLYRFVVGLCGIVFFSLLWSILLHLRWRWGVKALAYAGKKGLGIYVVSGIPMGFLTFQVTENKVTQYGMNIVQTLFILFWSIAIVEILGRIKGLHILVGQ